MAKIHVNDMNKEQLRELVSDMSFEALDLAQDLHFSKEINGIEVDDLIIKRLYDLAFMPFGDND